VMLFTVLILFPLSAEGDPSTSSELQELACRIVHSGHETLLKKMKMDWEILFLSVFLLVDPFHFDATHAKYCIHSGNYKKVF
jgi:hypothetical protein